MGGRVYQKGLIVYGYVIMSNHVHLLMQVKNNNLSDILRDFKKFTSQRIIAAVGEFEKRPPGTEAQYCFKSSS